MKAKLLTIGRTNDKLLSQSIDAYLKRVNHYLPFEVKELPDLKNTRSLPRDRQKELEGERLLASIERGDKVILLDERGKMLTSREFAGELQNSMLTLQRSLVFVIGGPYGFSKAVYDRADKLLSLSKMTMTHEMVRLFFIEQLYRAMTIIKGEPYHHD